jgi:chromosome segregation ATPase
MTAKQAVFLAYQQGKVDLTQLCQEHRSIQTRKVGKDITQIRFRDSESWMTLEDFHSNYRNKTLKNLSDLLTSASKVLPPKELLKGLNDECRQVVIKAGADYALANGYAVQTDKWNSLVDEYDQLMNEKENVAQQLLSVRRERDELAKAFEEHKQSTSQREATLRQLKEEIGGMGKLGMVKVSDVLGKFTDAGV